MAESSPPIRSSRLRFGRETHALGCWPFAASASNKLQSVTTLHLGKDSHQPPTCEGLDKTQDTLAMTLQIHNKVEKGISGKTTTDIALVIRNLGLSLLQCHPMDLVFTCVPRNRMSSKARISQSICLLQSVGALLEGAQSVTLECLTSATGSSSGDRYHWVKGPGDPTNDIWSTLCQEFGLVFSHLLSSQDTMEGIPLSGGWVTGARFILFFPWPTTPKLMTVEGSVGWLSAETPMAVWNAERSVFLVCSNSFRESSSSSSFALRSVSTACRSLASFLACSSFEAQEWLSAILY